MPILQTRKLRFREVKEFAQGTQVELAEPKYGFI